MNLPTLGSLRRLLALVLAAVLAPAVWADPVITSQAFNDNSVFTVSNTDLLQTNLSSVDITGSGGFFSNTPSRLTDGTFGSAGSDFNSSFARSAGGTVTFNLDLSVNVFGYNLTQIDTYAGWGDNGLDGQEYTIALSFASAPAVFTDLLTIPQVEAAGSGTSRTMVSITGTFVASNVAAIRFTFTSFENGSTAYREMDAFGEAAIPEPSTGGVLLGVGALVSAVAVRRFRRVS
jgi:hypothetical protein